ncbi:hypothetical protein PTKIN_Ptkin14bG0155400 [Pterospermum kingtungense]
MAPDTSKEQACDFGVSALSNCTGTLLVEWVAKPVKRQFEYVPTFLDKVNQFREKRDDLQAAKDRLQHQIDEALRGDQQIEDDVQRVQNKATKTLEEVSSLEEEIQANRTCFGRGPNLWWRYRLSRKLEKKILAIEELLKKMSEFRVPGRVHY